jgi:uncharacterized lipoprotein
MDMRKSVLGVGIVVLLAACGSTPEEKKAAAEAELTEEKTKTMQEYKECVKKAKEDQAKLDACERLLKAIEASEGGAKPE